MRKLMFSLVATLAFGSFAMANTLDVETFEAVENLELELLQLPNNFIQDYSNFEELVLPSCFEYIHTMYHLFFGSVNLENVTDFMDDVRNCRENPPVPGMN